MIEKREALDEVVDDLGHRLIDAINAQASVEPGVTPVECAVALMRAALSLVRNDDSWFDVLLDILEEQDMSIAEEELPILSLDNIQCARTMQ